MNTPILVLSLEDDPEFLSLVRECLTGDGIPAILEQIETPEKLVTALDRPDIDLVLANYQLSNFDGLSALAIIRENRPDLPLIVLSSVSGEEFAVEALRIGAADFVTKHRLARLAPAIRRALAETKQFGGVKQLAAAGLLASAIGHEINNRLAGIKISFWFVRRAIPEKHPQYEHLDLIEGELDLIAEIVRRMFDFYRPQRETVKDIALGVLCREVAQTLEPARQAANLRIKIDVPEDLSLHLAEDSFRQVLLNILENAVEASPESGQINVVARRSSPGVIVKVEDEGSGIPEAEKAQVFEPFYTTKSRSDRKCLGLGLAIARGLVQAANGTIEFTSREGKGTVFQIELPEERRELK